MSLFYFVVFDDFSGKSRFITTVLPKKFLQDPSCIGGTPAQIFPERNHLAFLTRFQRSSIFLTRFQRSSISRAKVVGLRKFSEFFENFISTAGLPETGIVHTTRITSERLQKVDDLTRKLLVRTCLRFNLAFLTNIQENPDLSLPFYRKSSYKTRPV